MILMQKLINKNHSHDKLLLTRYSAGSLYRYCSEHFGDAPGLSALKDHVHFGHYSERGLIQLKN